MRAKIQRRTARNRAPPKPQAPLPHDDVPPINPDDPIPGVDHVGNGLAAEPSIPPEIVQAIIRLNERVTALEQAPKPNVDLIGLELKARVKALELAIDVTSPGGLAEGKDLDAFADQFLVWLRKPN
jgi:hypothetical protein